MWEHPCIVGICPVLWWENWNWCEHKSHLFSGCAASYHLVRGGAGNGGTNTGASYELGLPIRQGCHHLIRGRGRSQLAWVEALKIDLLARSLSSSAHRSLAGTATTWLLPWWVIWRETENLKWKQQSFYHLISEVILLLYFIVAQTNSGTTWEGTGQRCEHQEVGP